MDSMELKSPKKKFRFSNRRHSKPAAVSVCLSAVSLIVFVVCLAVCVKNSGVIGRAVSIAAVSAFIAQIVSVIIAVRARKEKEIFMAMPNFALGFSLAAMLPWFYVYICGLTG